MNFKTYAVNYDQKSVNNQHFADSLRYVNPGLTTTVLLQETSTLQYTIYQL